MQKCLAAAAAAAAAAVLSLVVAQIRRVAAARKGIRFANIRLLFSRSDGANVSGDSLREFKGVVVGESRSSSCTSPGAPNDRPAALVLPPRLFLQCVRRW